MYLLTYLPLQYRSSRQHIWSPVHAGNYIYVKATLSKQLATLLPVTLTLLPKTATMSKQRRQCCFDIVAGVDGVLVHESIIRIRLAYSSTSYIDM